MIILLFARQFALSVSKEDVMIIKEYQYGNVTITTYRPELSDEENKKREEQLLIALQQFGKETKENTKKWRR